MRVRRHRAHGRHQRLAQHLAAEDALPAFLRAAAAEQVLLERLEVSVASNFASAGVGAGKAVISNFLGSFAMTRGGRRQRRGTGLSCHAEIEKQVEVMPRGRRFGA